MASIKIFTCAIIVLIATILATGAFAADCGPLICPTGEYLDEDCNCQICTTTCSGRTELNEQTCQCDCGAPFDGTAPECLECDGSVECTNIGEVLDETCSTCICENGQVLNTELGRCVNPCGPNESHNQQGDCECSTGYTGPVGNCVYSCGAGFEVNKANNGCLAVCGQNETRNPTSEVCECTSEFERYPATPTGTCVPICKPNQTRVGADCKCIPGYELVQGECLAECPVGQVRFPVDSATCLAACPANQERVDTTDCQCIDGYELNSSDVCIQIAPCSPKQTFNVETEECECTDPLFSTPDCTECINSHFDKDQGCTACLAPWTQDTESKCELCDTTQLSCQSDEIFKSSSTQCECQQCPPSPKCTDVEGTIIANLDDNTCGCTCPTGLVWDRVILDCKQPSECPDGQEFSATFSKCIDICSEDREWNNTYNKCVLICDSGKVWNNNLEQCVITCPTGQVFSEKHLVCVPICPLNQSINDTTLLCECSIGFKWDVSLSLCVDSVNDGCAARQLQWSTLHEQCVPICINNQVVDLPTMKCVCQMSCSDTKVPDPKCAVCVDASCNTKCIRGLLTQDCVCDCEDKWMGETCNTCSQQCIGKNSLVSPSCGCYCQRGLSGPDCRCISTEFDLTFTGLPIQLQGALNTNAKAILESEEVLTDLYTQINRYMQPKLGKDALSFRYMKYIARNENDVNSEATIILKAAWSDGCTRNALTYETKLKLWEEIVQSWESTRVRPIISGSLVYLSKVEYTESPSICDAFDVTSKSNRCKASSSSATTTTFGLTLIITTLGLVMALI